jgi:starch synthase
VKTGGLGDVSAALPAALMALGLDVRVLLPGYREVLDASPGAREITRFTACGIPLRLLEAKLPSGVPLLILDAPRLFARAGGPYQDAGGDDWNDNALRFGVLSRAAALVGSGAVHRDWRPDVVHCNDWPTALAPVYLEFAGGKRAASLVTIHNLAFQGVFPFAEIERLELPRNALGMEGLEFYGKASFLKGGLVYADAINTVSPTYAREIQGAELGFGLDGVLQMRADDLYGVLNGIDTQGWNPRTDPHIAATYDEGTLDRKLANKRELKRQLGLTGPDDVPLAVIVSRLTHQKGIDLVLDALPRLAALPLQIAVVGTGERALADRLTAAREKAPGALGVFIGFDEPLAHLAEAGGDFFLMPSRFEPCGMNQMYSQRYGTPPVVARTGGLVDTVDDGKTGFVMDSTDADGLVEAVTRAVKAWRGASKWREMQQNGMQKEFGWERAARAYIEIYERL